MESHRAALAATTLPAVVKYPPTTRLELLGGVVGGVVGGGVGGMMPQPAGETQLKLYTHAGLSEANVGSDMPVF